MVDQNAAGGNGSDSQRPENVASGDGKARSETKYPYYGIGQAIEMVQAVRRVGGKEASSDAIMRELGIAKNTDRRWAYGVPSAMLYGLIERVGRGESGRLKVTDLALRVTNPLTPEAGRAAKIAAMRTTELYTKLLEQFSGHPAPTREGLRNLLYTDHGIVESMALMAADAFLDSLKTAELLTPSGQISLDAAPAVAKENSADTPKSPAAPAGTQTLHVPADFIVYKCKLSRGRVIDIPLPPDFTAADVKRMNAFLETQIDDAEEVKN
jgi:hypothetical protein